MKTLHTNTSKKEHGMKIHTSRIKRHALLIFCTLTIALTFAATRLPLPGEVVSVVMVFIPTLIALGLTAMADGWGGVRALLGKLAQWRVRTLTHPSISERAPHGRLVQGSLLFVI